MPDVTFESNLNALLVATNPSLVVDTRKPARRHKRKRMAKKWLKRYGYKKEPDPNIYISANRRIVTMHPKIYQKLREEIGDEDKLLSGIKNVVREGGKTEWTFSN